MSFELVKDLAEFILDFKKNTEPREKKLETIKSKIKKIKDFNEYVEKIKELASKTKESVIDLNEALSCGCTLESENQTEFISKTGSIGSLAAAHNDIDLLKFLEICGIGYKSSNEQIKNTFIIACIYGAVEVVKDLLKECDAPPSLLKEIFYQSKIGINNPLSWVIDQGHSELVELFLLIGVDPYALGCIELNQEGELLIESDNRTLYAFHYISRAEAANSSIDLYQNAINAINSDACFINVFLANYLNQFLDQRMLNEVEKKFKFIESFVKAIATVNCENPANKEAAKDFEEVILPLLTKCQEHKKLVQNQKTDSEKVLSLLAARKDSPIHSKRSVEQKETKSAEKPVEKARSTCSP